MKTIVTILIPIIMHSSAINMVSITPQEAVTDFMEGVKTRQSHVMDKYMDNTYVNFLNNVQGDEAVIQRMEDALFANLSYEIEEIAVKDDVAVARIVLTGNDFSKVMKKYEKASYQYIMNHIYSDEVADKETLNAKCLEIYVKQIEKAAGKEPSLETVVFVPMVDDGYYGWNIVMTNEFMQAVLGNLDIPMLEP